MEVNGDKVIGQWLRDSTYAGLFSSYRTGAIQKHAQHISLVTSCRPTCIYNTQCPEELPTVSLNNFDKCKRIIHLLSSLRLRFRFPVFLFLFSHFSLATEEGPF